MQDVRWTSALHGSEWNGDLPQQAKMRRVYTGALLANLKKMKGRTLFMRNLEKERISIMVKNKVVIKERDAWSDLANFIGEMVAKYADAMGLDQLPNPDCYLRMKRMKQLYMELYKTENIEKFRSIIISIERNAAA